MPCGQDRWRIVELGRTIIVVVLVVVSSLVPIQGKGYGKIINAMTRIIIQGLGPNRFGYNGTIAAINVPLRGRVRFGHHVPFVIVSTVEFQKRCFGRFALFLILHVGSNLDGSVLVDHTHVFK